MKPFLKFFLSQFFLTSSAGSFDSATKCTTNYCIQYTLCLSSTCWVNERRSVLKRLFILLGQRPGVFLLLLLFLILYYYIFFFIVGVVAGVWRKQHLLKSIFEPFVGCGSVSQLHPLSRLSACFFCCKAQARADPHVVCGSSSSWHTVGASLFASPPTLSFLFFFFTCLCVILS